MKSTKYYVTPVLLLFCINLYGQYFKKLDMKDGLSNLSVLAIYQDTLGRMWFGTNEGVNIYDGERLSTYKSYEIIDNQLRKKKFINGVVDQIVGDFYGDVFLKTDGALIKYDIRKERFKEIYPTGISSIAVFDNEVWCAAGDSLFRYNAEADSLSFYQKLNTPTIWCMAKSGDKTWIGTAKGLYVLEGETVKCLLPGIEIFKLFVSSRNELWIASRMRGLYKIGRDGILKKEISASDRVVSEQIRSFVEDDQNNVWFGTFDGLQMYRPSADTYCVYRPNFHPGSLSHESVFSLYKDRQGTIWVGTYYGGVNYFNLKKDLFKYYVYAEANNNCLNYPIIGQIIEDKRRDLWICTDGGGVNRFNRKTNTFTYYTTESGKNSILHDNVKTITYDESRDQIYIGTYTGGLSLYDRATNLFHNYLDDYKRTGKGPDHIIYYSLFKDGWLYVTARNGFWRMHPDKGEFHLISNKDIFQTFEIDSRGYVWLAADLDLYKLSLSDWGKIESVHFDTLGNRKVRITRIMESGREQEVDNIHINEFIAPESLDFKHSNYVLVNGIYHSYLLVPCDGYKAKVMPGWLSLLINAGEGIDIDFFLHKQPKDKIQQRLGQQIRINRSKIKDASDTNADFDDLDSAIRSGYFLKQGLANNEDFYYMNLLITITAGDLEELQWRIQEMKKLLISQDMDLRSCYFLQEQGFLSSLPLVNLDKKLYELSKRNVLTTGAASCYPFVSYSICDDNGILFGVNKHNNSLVIADIFDSKQYKNSNIAILGTSGSGKTFTMQTMALRMRRKGIQVFIIAPLKGHEFYRAARNVGGTFIQISPASQNCINVMEIRKVDNSVNELLDGPTLDASALASKIQRLHVFFSLLIPDMSHEEKQLLDEALIKTYARKGITHKNESLIDPKHPDHYKAMPILGDVYDVLMETEDTKRLAHILNRLVHGSASSFNQQTNVDLTNKYTVLDISELTGSSDLLTVGMFVALDYVWDKAKENRTEEKAIFVDEVWQLIGASSNRLAAEFVLEIAKIIRAYSGAGIFATQDLNDFFALDDGKYGKGIINNCKTKIILNMEDEEAQRVKTILRLSETEVMNITHFQRGNGLISTNNNNITVEFKASNLEKELITTDRQELLEILKRQDKKVG